MKYSYKMVQIPPNIVVASKKSTGQDAAEYLENIVNEWAAKGWEFMRVDEIGVVSQPGCFGSLLGQKQTHLIYYVITLRKEA